MSDQDRFRALAVLAVQVALDAPARPRHGSVYIPSKVVEEIRAELDRVGIDWRAHHRELGKKAPRVTKTT